MSSTNKRRRTSISSTTSSRSSWRVPLAKQPARTALSAVFAEAPARSPSNQSAFALLESKYASPSPSSAFDTFPHSDSPIEATTGSLTDTTPESVDALSAREVPEQAVVQVIDVPNNTGDANVALTGMAPSTNQQQGLEATSENTVKSPSGWFRRGRQPTQRKISLTVDAPQSLPTTSVTPANSQALDLNPKINESVLAASSNAPSTLNATNGTIAKEMTNVHASPGSNVAESKDKRPDSISSGWFGSSRRSKAPQLQSSSRESGTSLPEQKSTSTADVVLNEASKVTINPQTDTKVVPLSDPQVEVAQKAQSSSSRGWFSRSKQTTAGTDPSSSPKFSPAPPHAAQNDLSSIRDEPLQTTTLTNASSQAIAIMVTDASPPLGQVGEPASASPSRTSWFRSTRTKPAHSEKQYPGSGVQTPITAPSSNPATPSSVSLELPYSESSESLVDESMTATVTPMSFAQASRTSGPSGWFRGGAKRSSIAPSVDSVVPSLPPSPKNESSASLSVIPIQNSSTTSLNSSSARYTLSFPILGRPKIRVDAGLKGDSDMQESTLQISLSSQPNSNNPPVAEISEVVEIPSIPPSAIDQAYADSSWWSYLGWSTASIIQAPAQEPLGSAPITAPESIASSSSSAQEQQQVQNGEIMKSQDEEAIRSETTSWFGFWAWNGQIQEAQAQEPSKSEAELIKEEALARENASSTTPALSPVSNPISQPNYDSNPISTDAVDNRASWTSFFSLRAAHGAKRVSPQEEVMDLDGDPDAPTSASTNAASPSARLGGKLSKSNDAISPPAVSSQPRSSSAGPSRKGQTAPPLTDSNSLRRQVVGNKRSSSTTSSRRSAPPPVSKAQNMVLPTFEDTFYTLPRALPPHQRPTRLSKVGRLVGDVLGLGSSSDNLRKEMKEWQHRAGIHVPTSYDGLRAARDVGRDLPRYGEVLGISDIGNVGECKRVAIIGIHGWFPGTIMRTLLGEPTGTSPKFASMMETAVLQFMEERGVTLEKLTSIPLEGEGTIDHRVEKLYQNLVANKEWVEDLHEADAVFVATHSQGSIVSTQLLDKLIADGHLRTAKNWEVIKHAADPIDGGINVATSAIRPPQKVCCLALCGIHLGPLLYLGNSSLVNPYLQYFESAAAKELFEFQDTESAVSKKYLEALENVLDHGAKFVYVASLDDQVVPIYSGIFTAVHHPRILRALYIDGDAYSSSDFLSNLLVLLLRLRNAGIDDGGLLTHLSEATAGSLSGIGHSTAYLDPGAYKLAVRFLFETSDALGGEPKLEFEPFTAKASRNDYEIPWALRGLVSDPRCQELFGKELAELRAAFDNWQPRTSALRDVRRKLEPIRGRRSRFAPDPFSFSHSPPSAVSPIPLSRGTR